MDPQEEEDIGEEDCEVRYILDPREFLGFCETDKKIKIMDERNPIYPHVSLRDISLHKKGPLEDKIYAKSSKYYCNIRRGNTLCEIYSSDPNGPSKLFMCRRGMKKFYDLEPEYIKVDRNLSYLHGRMRNRIFEQLDGVLEKGGHSIHIYRLFKENGEHCQISYISELSAWLFASKNVAILARTDSDLQEYYHKERFYWAKLVGVQFFKIIGQFSEEVIASLKLDIEGKTLLGEHCGYDKHQHITKYSEVQLIFYGLVLNCATSHCEPVQTCRQFLAKYSFKMSISQEVKGLKDKNTVYQNMFRMLKQVAEGSMEECGEGSVMYIIKENPETHRQTTIAMCKLKTAEYLIFRKLREMLKLNIARKGCTANGYQKYKFEVEQLTEHYFMPPRPLRIYLALAETAFQEVSLPENQITEDYLRYKFVEFLDKIGKQKGKTEAFSEAVPQKIVFVCLPRFKNSIEKYCKGKGLHVEYMYRAGSKADRDTLYILHMVPRLAEQLELNTHLLIAEYSEDQLRNSVRQLNNCQNTNKSHLISFVKSAEKEKSLKLLHEKIQLFKEQCKSKNIPYCVMKNDIQESSIEAIDKIISESSSLPREIVPKKPLKYVLLPLLMPGSGKSTLYQQLRESDFVKDGKWCLTAIESDEIRSNLMQGVDLDSEEGSMAFKETSAQVLEAYLILLEKELNRPPQRSQILYVDKAFCPGTIGGNIQKILAEKKQYVRVMVVTQKQKQTKFNDNTYPFSMNYLLVCLKRCLERDNHKTLSRKPYQIAKVVLKYYQMYMNYSEKSALKGVYEQVSVLHLPFVQEVDETVLNQHLKKKVEECLRMITPGFDSRDAQCFIGLIEGLYKFSSHIEDQKPTGIQDMLFKKLINI